LWSAQQCGWRRYRTCRPEFELQGWNGLFAPKGTPREIVGKLNAAARIAVESDAAKKRFADLSTVAPDAGAHTPEVLQQLVTRDVAKYHALLAGSQ
jgi:tripartite-type tricarboxylate transporter receptor subunit TctC